MQNKLKELKKAIHKACPELLELSFGCKYKIEGVINGHITDGSDEEKIKGVDQNYNPVIFHIADDGLKILGHPIGIAEVLRAIDYSRAVRAENKEIMISTQNSLDFCYWNLENDDLDWHFQNKPETIDFIYLIICK
jgi:hypothetical protein